MPVAQCPQCHTPLPPETAGLCAACAGVLVRRLFAEDEPPPPITAKGARLGPYILEKELGRGGMGTVWQARHSELDRTVAVKILTSLHLPGERERQRFLEEVRAAGRLDHPHIVPVLEAGEDGGVAWFAMPLLEGGALQPGPPPREAAALIARIARALEHSHGRGILHRDIKPGNILLDAGGQPRLADFGLARDLSADQHLTLSGEVMGTPAYMAPEQAAGTREATTAADIYGLGAVLYELLTGRAPFKAETRLELLRRVTETEPPRPRSLNAALDADLELICLKCLEKDPRRRYASAADMAADLERWSRGEAIHARPASRLYRLRKWTRRHPVRAVLAGMSLLCAGALGAVIYSYQQRLAGERDTLRTSLYISDVQVASQALEDGDYGLARRALAAHSGAGQRGFEWHWLRQQAEGQQLRILAQQERPLQAVAVLPGDGLILSGDADGWIRAWDPQDGGARGAWRAHTAGIVSLEVSADGTHIGSSGDAFARLWEWPAMRLAYEASGGNCRFAFAPRGPGFTISGGGNDAGRWRGRTSYLSWTNDLTRVPKTRPVALSLLEAGGHAAFSRCGSRLFTTGWENDLCLWEVPSGRLLHRMANPEPMFLRPGMDPLSVIICNYGGTGLGSQTYPASVVPARDIRGILREVFLPPKPIPEDALVVQTFESIGGICLDADTSPDGKFLATGCRDGSVAVLDNTSHRKVATYRGHAGPVQGVAWSPGGQTFASAGADGTLRLWDRAPAPPPAPAMLHRDVCFSTDSRWLIASDRASVMQDGEVAQLITADALTREVISARPWPLLNSQRSHTLHPANRQHRQQRAQSGGLIPRALTDPAWEQRAQAFNAFLAKQPREVLAWCVSNDGTLAAFGDYDGTLLLLDTATLKVVKKVEAPLQFVSGLNFSPDGTTLASCGAPLPHDPATGIAFRETITERRTGTGTGEVLLWTVPALTPGPPLEQEASDPAPDDLVFSADGHTLGVAYHNADVRLFDAGTGRLLTRLATPEPASCIAFSPDGRTLATSSDTSTTVTLWHPDTGRLLAHLTNGVGGIQFLLFSPDGQTLAAATWRGDAITWSHRPRGQ